MAITGMYITLVSEGQHPDNNNYSGLHTINNSLLAVTEGIDVTTVNKAVLRGRTRAVVLLLNGLTEQRLQEVYPEIYQTLKVSLRTLRGVFLEVPTHQLLGVQKPILPVAEDVE